MASFAQTPKDIEIAAMAVSSHSSNDFATAHSPRRASMLPHTFPCWPTLVVNLSTAETGIQSLACTAGSIQCKFSRNCGPERHCLIPGSDSPYAPPPAEISGWEVAAEVWNIIIRTEDDTKMCLKDRTKLSSSDKNITNKRRQKV